MLDGIRVVELSSGVAAGYAGMLLRHAGATVVRVPLEDARSGDVLHEQRRRYRVGLDAWLHTGKEVRPWQKPATIRELVATADVVVDDIAEARRDVLGATLDSRPPVPWIVVTPYGRACPGGSDLTVSALSGAMWAIGEPDEVPLALPHHQAAVQAGAVAAAIASAAAGTAVPGIVEVTWTDVISSYAATNATLFSWEREGHRAAASGGAYPYTILPCKDGLVCLAARTNGEWRRILEAIGNPTWASDPRYQDVRAIAADHAEEVDGLLTETLRTFTREELLANAIELGCTIAPVRSVDDLIDDADLRDAEAVVAVGDVPVPRLNWFDSVTLRKPPRGLRETASAPTTAGFRPLEGIRVLDFGWVVSGPLAGQMLAALGAEVIKLENRVRADSLRLRGAYVDGAIDWARVNNAPTFHALNRGKRSVAVNIKEPEGLEIVRQLVATVDVVLDNFSAGAMDRMGLGDDVLAACNPDLVHVSLSPTGLRGQLASLRGYAATTGSLGGLEGSVGYTEDRVTGMLTFGLADYGAGAHAAFAAIAALRGRGPHSGFVRIDASQLEATVLALGAAFAARYAALPLVQANTSLFASPHGVFAVADGLVALSVGTRRAWAGLVDLLGLPMPNDLSLEERLGKRAQIEKMIAVKVATMDRALVVERLRDAGVDAAPVLRMQERSAHAYFTGRRSDEHIDLSDHGTAVVPAVPWTTSDGQRPGFERGRAPDLGEDTDWALQTLLHMDRDEASSLRTRGIVG